MRLLLLGCTGFIGRELIPELLAGGHHLTVISRKSPQKLLANQGSKQLIHLKLDPAKQESWQNKELLNALEKSNVVINFAGEPIADKRWTSSHCKTIEVSRLNTTQGLIDAMNRMKKPPEVLINASAIGFYGTSQENVFNEESQSGNDFLASLCKNWESTALKKPSQTRLIIFRIGIVLSQDGGALGKMLPVFRSGFGGPIGNGQQWMSWIHRSDLCKMIVLALSNKQWQGVINAVAPNPEKMCNFSDLLGRTLGRPTLLPVPGSLLRFLLGDGAKVVLEGQNVFSKRLDKLKFTFKYPELKEALRTINK